MKNTYDEALLIRYLQPVVNPMCKSLLARERFVVSTRLEENRLERIVQ